MGLPPVVDKRGLAKILGCSTRTIDNYIATGQIPLLRLSQKFVRFIPSEVLAAMQQNATGGSSR
jgi:predicted DNA-binding transcriptional regulator AlpA